MSQSVNERDAGRCGSRLEQPQVCHDIRRVLTRHPKRGHWPAKLRAVSLDRTLRQETDREFIRVTGQAGDSRGHERPIGRPWRPDGQWSAHEARGRIDVPLRVTSRVTLKAHDHALHEIASVLNLSPAHSRRSGALLLI